MRLISLLNHYQHFPGFVYDKARHCAESQTIEITVRPRRGSKPVCSCCHKPGPGYDHLGVRRFEFVPLWGCMLTHPPILVGTQKNQSTMGAIPERIV